MCKRLLGALVLTLLCSTPAWAQNTSTTQMQLVTSQRFLDRVAYLLSQQAVVVKAEALSTTCHVLRSQFANEVISSPTGAAQSRAVLLAGSTNVIGTVTGSGATLDSSATDAALLSQIATSWNAMSRCDTGS